MQWSICVHSDDTSGHQPDCSITTLVKLYLYQVSKEHDDIYFRELNLLYAQVNRCAFR